MKRAEEFAAQLGVRVVIPTKPLLYRKEGEALNYFTETNLQATFDLLKKPAAQSKPRRVK